MKYVFALIAGMIAMVVILMLNAFVFDHCIGDFTAGWITCAVYHLSKEYYEEQYD